MFWLGFAAGFLVAWLIVLAIVWHWTNGYPPVPRLPKRRRVESADWRSRSNDY